MGDGLDAFAAQQLHAADAPVRARLTPNARRHFRARPMAISGKTKVALLAAVTALAVSYVRQILQYRAYSWDSFGDFALFWFIHYIGVWLLVAISFAFIKTWEKFFLGDTPEYHKLDVDEAMYYVTATILVTAVVVFLLAHWPGAFDEGY